MNNKPVRTAAVYICHAVIYKQQHLSESLTENLPKQPDPQYQSALKALCFETIRHYVFLSDIWRQCVTKTPKDKRVRVIMSIALCEFIYLKKASHVVVNEAINTAKLLKKQWAKGLINATLRKAIKNIENEPQSFKSSNDFAKFSHPEWWIQKIQKDWPKHWQDILQANNKKPPLWIRSKEPLSETDQAEPHTTIKCAYKIPSQDITKNQQFKEGLISVQDASAQLAAFIMQPQDNEKILDACAAPGGKTCHLLELNPKIQLDAIELYPNRTKKIIENLDRLKLSAHVITNNAADPKNWFEAPLYDQILLDAPCSASGIIRRQPDIKFLRKPDDLIKICLDQQNLLNQLANILATKGKFLYATCSVFPQENSDQIKLFLKSHPQFSEITLEYPFAIRCEYGIQILPGSNDMDGFYYCYLQKHDD